MTTSPIKPGISSLARIIVRLRWALMRWGRSREEAEDLVQKAWLRMTSYEQAQPVRNVEAFLMRVAVHLAIDACRAQRARGEEVPLAEEVLVALDTSVEDVVMGRERLARLAEGLRRLPVRYREDFLAHRVEGLSYREIAERSGRSHRIVEVRVARAVRQLARWMEEGEAGR